MSDGIEYLTFEDLLRLVRLLQAGPVRDVGLLEGCAGRPPSRAFGVDAYPDKPSKAAALRHSVAGTHASLGRWKQATGVAFHGGFPRYQWLDG